MKKVLPQQCNIDKFNQEVLDKINDILGDNNEI